MPQNSLAWSCLRAVTPIRQLATLGATELYPYMSLGADWSRNGERAETSEEKGDRSYLNVGCRLTFGHMELLAPLSFSAARGEYRQGGGAEQFHFVK